MTRTPAPTTVRVFVSSSQILAAHWLRTLSELAYDWSTRLHADHVVVVSVVDDDGHLGRVRHGQGNTETRQQIHMTVNQHWPPSPLWSRETGQVSPSHGQWVEQRRIQVWRLDV